MPLLFRPIDHDQIIKTVLSNHRVGRSFVVSLEPPVSMGSSFIKRFECFKIILNATVDETRNALIGKELPGEMSKKRA